MTSPRERVATLWQEHLSRPFPPRLRGVEVGDIDLVLLDAYLAGCISAWLGLEGDLDSERLRILRNCLDDLDQVLLTLDDPTEHEYYAALGEGGRTVLAAQQNPR